jgi:TPP-dependent pyruvate/acetoin dehydrogenase alpha subunit
MILDRTDLLRQRYVIRAFEEMAERLYAIGKVHGTMHLAMGMKAPAVGAVAALRPKDLMFSTHRGHGYCMAKGADLNFRMAELLCKASG